MRKEHQRLAEVATENYLKDRGFNTRRTVKSKWHKIDFFGADVIGVSSTGKWWIQATIGEFSSVTKRRRKLENQVWLDTDHVFIFQMVERQNPAKARRKDYFFRVHELMKFTTWKTWEDPIEILKEWFKVEK